MWSLIETVTPGRGCPLLFNTRPRTTAARTGRIVPKATPVWIGLGPEYKKAVDPATVVTSVGLVGGATVLGSGGSPGIVGPREMTRSTDVPRATEFRQRVIAG